MDTTPYPEPVDTDLMLVFPPFGRLLVSMENVGIEYIAAAVRAAGYTCTLINAGLYGLTADDVSEILRRSRFRVLGLSTIHWTMPAALDIARAARQSHPDCHIIFGGLEAALDAERILTTYPFVDSIGMGEGEHTVTELLRALANGSDWRTIDGLAFCKDGAVVYSPTPRLLDSIDDLPFPARDDIAAVLASGGPVSISSSRGCPCRCSYCSVLAFYGLSRGRSWRGRSPQSVVAEMRELYDTHGARLFSFIDETVVGPGERGTARLMELAALIRKSKMKVEFFMTMRADQVEPDLLEELKSAGLRKVELGIETMAPGQLRRFGKTTSVGDNHRALSILGDLGIAAELFMIPLDPHVTEEELRLNLSFYQKRFASGRAYDVTPLSFGNHMYPYPGTAARITYQKNGWLNGKGRLSFHATDPHMQTAGRAMILFTAVAEPAFPMCYLGLGNLWVNSAKLPAPVVDAIGTLCASIGTILVEFAEWILEVARRPRPIPIGDINSMISDLRVFLKRLAALRDELHALVAAHGEHKTPAHQPGTDFARALHALGMHRKQQAAGAGHAMDETDVVTGILDILTKDDMP